MFMLLLVCFSLALLNVSLIWEFCVVYRCMFDSQLTGSSSHFLPQSHKDKLQFELEAFRFQHGNSGVVRYATAFLPGRCWFHIIAQKCRFCFFFMCLVRYTLPAAWGPRKLLQMSMPPTKPVHSPVGKTLAVLLQNSHPQISSSVA